MDHQVFSSGTCPNTQAGYNPLYSSQIELKNSWKTKNLHQYLNSQKYQWILKATAFI